MNLIAIDIGNTNIAIGLFLKGEEQFVKSVPGESTAELTQFLKSTWEMIPVAKSSKEGKRDGVLVASSVKFEWTEKVRDIVKQSLGEKILLISKDIPYPIELSIKEPQNIGADRVLAASAAYAVAEHAVVVADFGTAVTIDLVDDRGVFCGGVIFPGFEMSANALHNDTAQLPKVTVKKPDWPFGKNTVDAINAGLYYSAISSLQEIVRRYAETLGTWPQTIITGSGAKLIRDDCEFVDNYVPNLVIKGIALAYRKFLESRE
ncbi:MAG: type III pantothenate kinase [Sedimentisphaerales bacterium]|nr:type III pantothenate kinase [Sedimentisphaerales bacterium]